MQGTASSVFGAYDRVCVCGGNYCCGVFSSGVVGANVLNANNQLFLTKGDEMTKRQLKDQASIARKVFANNAIKGGMLEAKLKHRVTRLENTIHSAVQHIN